MKQINLSNDFGIVRDSETPDDTLSDAMISLRCLVGAVNLGYKEGLPAEKRRIWASIESRIKTAAEKEESALEVNDYELVFLRQAFEKAVIPASESNVFTIVENAVLDAKETHLQS